MASLRDVLAFWFGGRPGDAVATAQEKAPQWWSKNARMDRRIREGFLDLVQEAAEDRLRDWAPSPRGRLALILLTDQFPRSMYRGTRQAFAYHALALNWCVNGLAEGVDTQLLPVEHWFYNMPNPASTNQIRSLVFEASTRRR